MAFGTFGDGGLEAFNSNADVIERVLGELMGLELARQYAWYDETIGNVGADVEWNVPSQTNPFLIVVAVNDGDRADPVPFVREQFQQCWENGRNWASGIADQIKRYGKLYGDVDVLALRDVADLMETQVAMKLDGALTSNWSNNDDRGTSLEKSLSNFQGEFAGKLHGFYTNVGDHVNSWASVASTLAAGYAGTAAIIDRCQHDMIEWAIKTRRHCEAQLKNWADSGGFGILYMQNQASLDAAETIATLTDIVSFGSSVAGLFPPAAPIAGTVGTVSGIVGTIVDATASAPDRPVTFNAMEALDIWGWEDSGSGAAHELGSKIIDGCSNALRELRDRQSGGDPSGTADVVAEVNRRIPENNWFAPNPEGMSNPSPDDLWHSV